MRAEPDVATFPLGSKPGDSTGLTFLEFMQEVPSVTWVTLFAFPALWFALPTALLVVRLCLCH